MIDLAEAIKILSNNFPQCIIKKYVIYDNKFIFYAPTTDILEGEMDPYYYVNIENGNVGEFPICILQNINCIDAFIKEGINIE